MSYQYRIYRDCDALMGCLPRLRKVVVELYEGDRLRDRVRLFAGPLFRWRLANKKRRMERRAAIMKAAEG